MAAEVAASLAAGVRGGDVLWQKRGAVGGKEGQNCRSCLTVSTCPTRNTPTSDSTPHQPGLGIHNRCREGSTPGGGEGAEASQCHEHTSRPPIEDRLTGTTGWQGSGGVGPCLEEGLAAGGAGGGRGPGCAAGLQIALCAAAPIEAAASPIEIRAQDGGKCGLMPGTVAHSEQRASPRAAESAHADVERRSSGGHAEHWLGTCAWVLLK